MRITIAIVFLFALITTINGQSYKGLKDIHLTIEPVNSFIEIDSSIMDNQAMVDSLFYDFYANESFSLNVSVLLSDTMQVNKIFVKIGRTENGNEIFEGDFSFDVFSLEVPKTYERNKYLVSLGLGNYSQINELFLEVYIESTEGTVSKILSKNYNP